MAPRITDLILKMTFEGKIGFLIISTTRIAGETWRSDNMYPKGENTSGFNEEEMVQNVSTFSRKTLPNPTESAEGTTRAVVTCYLRHFILPGQHQA